jgi:K+-sensing histidine kinase KdpD
LGDGGRGRGCGDRIRQTHDRRTPAARGRTGDLEVEIDPRLASGALSHILENAAQYSPAGREIAVDARVDYDGLHISVTDQGPVWMP